MDFITIDVYDRPPGGAWMWSRSVRSALRGGVPGLRSITINHANHATHELVPKLLPGGRALVAAWDSRKAAKAAFGGPLGSVLTNPNRFSLDGDVVRSGRRSLITIGMVGPRLMPTLHPSQNRTRWSSLFTGS